MSSGVGHRHDLDLALLWLWLWPEAVALIRPLAWKPPYASNATGAALKSKKKKKKRKEKKRKKNKTKQNKQNSGDSDIHLSNGRLLINICERTQEDRTVFKLLYHFCLPKSSTNVET